MSKVTTLRNITIPRITSEFGAKAEESKCNDPAAIYILKKKIATNKGVQTYVLDTVIGLGVYIFLIFPKVSLVHVVNRPKSFPRSACENCIFDQTTRFFQHLGKYFDEIGDK